MSSPNSIATAILANTGQSRNDYYGGGLGGIETPLTGRSFLSVSIGNTTTESMASSIVSPRTRGRWDRRISDVESGSMYSPTAAPPAPPSSSWLTDDDGEASSVRSGVLDTRPFPSFGPSSSIAPDSSYYSQIARFQGVRNSVSLPQPWRRRKESTTTGSYTTSTDDSDEEDDEDDDASTISGSRHEGQQRQHEQDQDAVAATSAAVDLFSQHQFIMPKPDETTPLIAADDVLCFAGGGGYDETSSACVK
ncbi:hypothetical protein B0T13DRAFT_403862 [Neurospora crassa]|nr:hypothetical protein B0T13DRAFT_403862 [Neurospora crassa]